MDPANYELVFEGVDTHAAVILNNDTIGYCNNMFRTWVFDIHSALKIGDNTLEVVFYPVNETNNTDSTNFPVVLPDKRAFSRKAPYHSGWDWGPKFETCGIWRKVEIRSWKSHRISSTYIHTDSIANNTAFLHCQVNIEAEKSDNATIIINADDDSFVEINKLITLNKGINTVNIPILINNPLLWWCNGKGEAKIYRFNITVTKKNYTCTKTIQAGIRTVELVKTLDTIGESFYFELNGEPVYALGANWVPTESFPGNTTEQKYRELLNKAQEAGFNMMRVWGGGYYENETFYMLCDSLGIMVWQDFMFACSMYPGNDAFIENLTHELINNIKRLRQHPSIVLWCGNNEVLNGWNDWGWQKQLGYSISDSIQLMEAYNKTFKKLIPETLMQLDETRPYHESSPSYGWGHTESNTHGDSHYWGVWWGMEPFDILYEKTGRFMSEYGFQGCPPIAAFNEFLDSSDINLQSKELKNHQKHPFGFEAIETYLQRYFLEPQDFEEYVYYSQLLQAKAMQTALDAHLSAKPHCMGSLFWQFNDCWPVISWSVIDYYGYQKAAYYTVKNMFRNQILAAKPIESGIEIYLVSHSSVSDSIECTFTLTDFYGKILNKQNLRILNNTTEAIKVFTLNYSDITLPLADVFLHIETNTGFERNVLFVPEKDLNLPKSQINYQNEQSGDSIYLFLTSPTFIPSVYLEPSNRQNWSNNFFDIMPGDTVKVGIKYPNAPMNFNPKIMNLMD
jgi:beta-mannosidase